MTPTMLLFEFGLAALNTAQIVLLAWIGTNVKANGVEARRSHPRGSEQPDQWHPDGGA